MTLLNAWWYQGRSGDGPVERRAFVQCDRCLPPQLGRGSESQLREAGWRFEHLESGRHHCWWCMRKGLNRRPRRLSPPEDHPALPNLVVIGAAKCGTTSMHRYLSLHPEVHMSRNKETSFFQDPGCLERLDLYATYFDARAAVRGEASTFYTHHPLLPGVARRMHAAIPDAKLIYLVRDPVDRIVSGRIDSASRGRNLGRFDGPRGDDLHDIEVATSRYAMQLEQYREVFPAEQILVVDQAELLTHREEELRRVFRFLGVDEGFRSPEFEEMANTRDSKRRKTAIYKALSHHRAAFTLRRLLPRPVRRVAFAPAKRLTSRPLDVPEIERELRERLAGSFVDDVTRLRSMTGMEFASWRI